MPKPLTTQTANREPPTTQSPDALKPQTLNPGKSLCFNVPVLSSVTDANGPFGSVTSARALYIYPTKALAQDQLRAL